MLGLSVQGKGQKLGGGAYMLQILLCEDDVLMRYLGLSQLEAGGAEPGAGPAHCFLQRRAQDAY